MANNYLQYSEVLADLTKEEAEWVATLSSFGNDRDDEDHFNEDGTGKTELGKLAEELWGDQDVYISCEMESPVEGKCSVWFYSEEGNDPYAAAQVVQEFIRKFRKGQGFTWTLQWAEFCSKLRLNEFGGGALAVGEHAIKCKGTGLVMEELLAELSESEEAK